MTSKTFFCQTQVASNILRADPKQKYKKDNRIVDRQVMYHMLRRKQSPTVVQVLQAGVQPDEFLQLLHEWRVMQGKLTVELEHNKNVNTATMERSLNHSRGRLAQCLEESPELKDGWPEIE